MGLIFDFDIWKGLFSRVHYTKLWLLRLSVPGGERNSPVGLFRLLHNLAGRLCARQRDLLLQLGRGQLVLRSLSHRMRVGALFPLDLVRLLSLDLVHGSFAKRLVDCQPLRGRERGLAILHFSEHSPHGQRLLRRNVLHAHRRVTWDNHWTINCVIQFFFFFIIIF